MLIESFRFNATSETTDIIACHLIPGQKISVGSGSLVVELSGKDPSFLCVHPDTSFIVPHGDLWYAVSLQKFHLEIGFQEVIPYRLQMYPDHQFQLGFNCEMRAYIAHIGGFKQCISDKEEIRSTDIRSFLRNTATPLVQNAVYSVLNPDMDYETCTAKKNTLEHVIEEALFGRFFEFGMCIKPHSLVIKTFSKPTMEVVLGGN